MRAIYFVFFFALHHLLFAQMGTIRGVVKDSHNPIEFATVYITPETDSTKIVTGSVSDEAGVFKLERIPVGSFWLYVQMMGFVTAKLPVRLEDDRPVDLADILLVPNSMVLGSVEIIATKDLIQKTEEGLVVNAASNLTQIGGTAADLLKNMPGVLVGADGEVTLRGKTPLTLINGRISGIAGIDRAAQMQQIPASSIDRIEIINNPSSKYDADAEGGIINIILKKNNDAGTNGAFAIGTGRGDRYRINASALLNNQAGKWNIGGAYDNWYTTRTRSAKGDRINYAVPDRYYLTQRRFDERLVFFQNAKATVDFAPNKKNNFSFEGLWAFPGEDNRETLKNTYETISRDFTGGNQRYANEIRRSNTVEGALKYVRKFDNPEKVLTANVSNAFNKEKEDTDITTTELSQDGEPLATSSIQRTHVYQYTNLLNYSVDYAQPLTPRGFFETGYKGIMRYLNSDYERATLENDAYVSDPLNTNVFKFSEQIHAAYAQATGWSGDKDAPRWKYNVGLRAEQVWNNGKTVDLSTSFKNQYFNLFPSGGIAYYTQKQHNVRLSYSKRITRPSLGQLSPFTDITDSLNQRSGNPGLEPELIHLYELSYQHQLSKGSVSVAAFYRIRNNAILPYTVLDENGVAFTQPQNFGKAVTLGTEAIASYSPLSFYSFNASLSAFRVTIDDTGNASEVSKNLISWYAKLVNTFLFSKNGTLQVIANYTAPTAIPQGESVAVYFVDAGFQYKIRKGKSRVGAVITDLFNTQKSGFITSDSNFVFSRIFKQDTRAIMVTFGYTFRGSFREKLMENRFKND
jgi:outer membrane receptor protein involved in Fe transport